MIRDPLRPLGGLLLAAALTACGANDPPKTPTPPDVDDLLAAFETVDGVLDAESAKALVQGAAEDAVTLAAIAALMVELDAAVGELDVATEDQQALTARPATGQSTQGLTSATPRIGERAQALDVRAGAWARLTHICPGADRDVITPTNGDIELRTVFDAIEIAADGLQQLVIWGEATRCLLGTDDGVSTLDADITGAVDLDESNDLALSIIGVLTPTQGETSPFDLRLRQAGEIFEIVREVDGAGSFLIGVEQLDDGLQQATLTDADGTWTCTFDTDEETGACRRDGQVLSWP